VSEPVFLTVAQVEALHEQAIQEHGGTLGLRDRNTLEAASTHPQNVYFYGGGDLFDIAAAYAFYIAEAQAFLDGNKRAAIAAAFAFLKLNGIVIRGGRDQLYSAMIGIAEHRIGKAELADLFRNLAQS
jgi:death on curing protein